MDLHKGQDAIKYICFVLFIYIKDQLKSHNVSWGYIFHSDSAVYPERALQPHSQSLSLLHVEQMSDEQMFVTVNGSKGSEHSC